VLTIDYEHCNMYNDAPGSQSFCSLTMSKQPLAKRTGAQGRLTA